LLCHKRKIQHMPIQKTVRFTSESYLLTGTLHLPDKPRAAAVIGCHGLLADRSSPKQIALGEALNAIGLAYLRFDHRGCGDSQGALEFKTLLASRCRDLSSAEDFLKNHPAITSVIGFFGSSFGGTVAMATAAGCLVEAVVTYAAPVRSHTVGSAAAHEIRNHHAVNEKDTSGFSFDIREQLGRLGNILIMHGTGDEIVPADHARIIYAAAREPKKLIWFDEGDHRMTNADHQRRFIEACTQWFKPFR
jgi:uncharacterized protein